MRSRRKRRRRRTRNWTANLNEDLWMVSLSIWPLELNWWAVVVDVGTEVMRQIHSKLLFLIISSKMEEETRGRVYCISSRKEVPTYQECVVLPPPAPPHSTFPLIRFLFHRFIVLSEAKQTGEYLYAEGEQQHQKQLLEPGQEPTVGETERKNAKRSIRGKGGGEFLLTVGQTTSRNCWFSNFLGRRLKYVGNVKHTPRTSLWKGSFLFCPSSS